MDIRSSSLAGCSTTSLICLPSTQDGYGQPSSPSMVLMGSLQAMAPRTLLIPRTASRRLRWGSFLSRCHYFFSWGCKQLFSVIHVENRLLRFLNCAHKLTLILRFLAFVSLIAIFHR